MNKRLLIIGSNSVHVDNFISLIKDYFDDILLLTSIEPTKPQVDYQVIDFKIKKNGYKNYKNLQKIIYEFKPTTVHIHQANTEAFLTILALRNYRVHTILTAWGSDILVGPKKRLLLKWKVQYILNHVNIVTADSNTVLIEANNLVKKNLETYNINFGIEIPDCTVKKENIIYSNRLHNKIYNINKIILSFNKFVRNNPSWKLVIAGIGPESKKLRELVSALNLIDKVEFIGWVDSKINYENYCKSKIYVSIPQSDSISISLMESIASNCIVFVSDLPANREVIDSGSSLGFIVNDLENIDFLKFGTINTEEYNKERENIIKKFSKKNNQKRFIDLYERSEGYN